MGEIRRLQIGNVTLENSTDGRRDRPAISFALQGTGSGTAVHGDGQRKGDPL